ERADLRRIADVFLQYGPVLGHERVGRLDDDDAARAEKGQRVEFGPDRGPFGAVAGNGRDGKGGVGVRKEEWIEGGPDLALEKRLVAGQDVNGPGLGLGGG